MAEFGAPFARNVRVEVCKEDGRTVRHITFRAVIKRRVENDAFVEKKPEGTDTRSDTERRRFIWRQVSQNLETKLVGRVKSADVERRVKDAVSITLNEWREQMELEEESASQEKEPVVTVSEYVSRYIDRGRKVDGTELSRSTLLDYRFVSGYLARGKAAIADMDVKSLKPRLVRDWEDGLLEDGLSNTTVGKAHRLLHVAMQDAVLMEVIPSNPCAGVRPPKRTTDATKEGVDARSNNALDHDGRVKTVKALVAMNRTPVVVAALIALYVGLRQGECCGLQWKDVDLVGVPWPKEGRYQSVTFDGPKLRVRQAIGRADRACYVKPPKTANGYRVIPLCGQLLEVLKERRSEMWDEWAEAMEELGIEPTDEAFGELYVVGGVDGGFQSPMVLSRNWSVTSKNLGLVGTLGRSVGFHDLRRTVSTVADAHGVGSKARKYILGHSERDLTAGVYTAPDSAEVLRATRIVARELDGTHAHDGNVYDFPRTGTES